MIKRDQIKREKHRERKRESSSLSINCVHMLQSTMYAIKNYMLRTILNQFRGNYYYILKIRVKFCL